MYVLPGEYTEPTRFQALPDTRTWQERGQDQRAQFAELVASNFREQQYVQASNNLKEARVAAYDKRIADIAAATGVNMQRPWGVEVEFDQGPGVKAFNEELRKLEERFPDKAGVIRAHEPVAVDVLQLQRDTVERLRKAEDGAKDLGMMQRGAAIVIGAGGAAVRDPMNWATSAVKGQLFVAKTIWGRIVQQVATEGAINAGAEAAIQLASEDAKRKAGLPVGDFWKQVGLAAAFGGGLGGAFEGLGHVLSKTGRATPEAVAAMERMKGGDMAPDDLRTVADAMGVKLVDDDLATLARAREVDADLAATLEPDLDPKLADEMARAMTEGSRPPGLRDDVADVGITDIPRGNQPSVLPEQRLTPENMPEGNQSFRLQDDPGFTAYVAEQNSVRIQKLEQAIAMNEADIAHLRDDGALDALPSERDFSSMRATDDVDRAHRVVQELETKVARAKAEIASGKAFNTDDVALQKRFAEERGARTIVPPEVKAQGLGDVNAVKAQEMATARLVAAGGEPVTAKPKAADMVQRDTLDILDALPAGTDVNGNPIVTTHAEMTDYATRLGDLADVIAACRA